MSIFRLLGQRQFGKLPSGKRLERIKKSPNYKNGAFQNQSITPDLTDGSTYFSIMKEFFLKSSKSLLPASEIPSVKTNLYNLDRNKNVLVWLGHSSYFFQVNGMRFLVDPVLSGSASPFSFTTKAIKGTDRYTVDDFPMIDYLIITHDHYDHLDYKTILKLKPKVRKVICGLGTGEHFEYWGYRRDKIVELDWHEDIMLENLMLLTATPARHFSGRGFKRNQSLWTSFVLQSATQKIFIGGDGGYDKHFAEIGNAFGPFDLAILENGQYNKSWKHIHLMPEEILQAAKDLNAKRILPVHNSKFLLSTHSWDEPLNLIEHNNEKEQHDVITPMIGEKVVLNDVTQQFSQWWKEVR